MVRARRIRGWMEALPMLLCFLILAHYMHVEVHELGHALMLLPGYFLGIVTRIEIHTHALNGVTLWWAAERLPDWYRYIVSLGGVLATTLVAMLLIHKVAPNERLNLGQPRLWVGLGFLFIFGGLWNLHPSGTRDGAKMADLTTEPLQQALWVAYALFMAAMAMVVFRDAPDPQRRWMVGTHSARTQPGRAAGGRGKKK